MNFLRAAGGEGNAITKSRERVNWLSNHMLAEMGSQLREGGKNVVE